MMMTRTPEYPEATIREIGLAIFVTDVLLTDFECAEDALRWARRLFESVDTEPLWSDGKHHGDCTKQPCPCTRCIVEDYEDRARDLAINEDFDV